MATPLFKDEFLSLLDKHLPESECQGSDHGCCRESHPGRPDARVYREDPLHAENMRRALRQWKKHLGIVDAVVADGEGHNLDMLIDFLLDRNGLNMESTVPVILTPSDALNIRILSDIDEDGDRRSC